MKPQGRVREWAEARWDRRNQDGLEWPPRGPALSESERRRIIGELISRAPVLEVVRSVEVAGAPEAIWALIQPAANAMLLDENVVAAFTVPGTPEGSVGERQCHVRRADDGTLHTRTYEIVECDPFRRMVVEEISTDGTQLVPNSTTIVLAGSADRTLLAYRYAQKAVESVHATLAPAITAALDRELYRVRELVEAGWTLESPPEGRLF